MAKSTLPESWSTREAHPTTVAKLLHRLIGEDSACWVYRLGGQDRYYIVRYLDGGAGRMLKDQTTGELYENPRPHRRPLEILGVADTLSKVLWILRMGKPAAVVGNGPRPRLDGSGNWTGFVSSGGIEIPAGLLEMSIGGTDPD